MWSCSTCDSVDSARFRVTTTAVLAVLAQVGQERGSRVLPHLEDKSIIARSEI